MPWGRILIEGVVIVGSILLAFALDAWWDNQSRLGDLREQATVVADEMTSARAALQSSLDAHDLYAGVASHLAETLRSVDPGADVIVHDTLIASLLPQATADVTTGSIEAFIEAGGLELIDDRAIREAMLGWTTRIEDLQDDEIYLRNFDAADLARHLRMNYDIANAERWSIQWLRARFGAASPVDPDELGSVALRHEPQLLNLLAAREAEERGLRRGLLLMIDEAEAITAALEGR